MGIIFGFNNGLLMDNNGWELIMDDGVNWRILGISIG